jgi:DNA-binding transcriptional MerR regulator
VRIPVSKHPTNQQRKEASKRTSGASLGTVPPRANDSLDAASATPISSVGPAADGVEPPSLRIGDVAARVGVSTRTLRYYEELGILSPSDYTPGGERRYRPEDLRQLERILELKELLGMNLEEIKETLASQVRLDELRAAYREHNEVESAAARVRRRSILVEALELRADLIARMDDKLKKMTEFRSQLASDADRCRSLLAESEVDDPAGANTSVRGGDRAERAPIDKRPTGQALAPHNQRNPSTATNVRSRRALS